MSELNTTLNDLLFPTEGEREFEPGHIVAHIEQHGIHYLDKKYNVIHHSQKDNKPIVEKMVFQFIGWIVEYESAVPIDHFNIEMTRDHSTVQYRTGWLQKPKIKKNATKPTTNLNNAKARRSQEHIVRSLLIETGRIETIDGPLIDGKLKDLVNAISDQGFDDLRDIDTYSDILKEIRIHTEQSAKK